MASKSCAGSASVEYAMNYDLAPARLILSGTARPHPSKCVQVGEVRLDPADQLPGDISGIGLAAVKRFVEDGAYVFITGRRQGSSTRR